MRTLELEVINYVAKYHKRVITLAGSLEGVVEGVIDNCFSCKNNADKFTACSFILNYCYEITRISSQLGQSGEWRLDDNILPDSICDAIECYNFKEKQIEGVVDSDVIMILENYLKKNPVHIKDIELKYGWKPIEVGQLKSYSEALLLYVARNYIYRLDNVEKCKEDSHKVIMYMGLIHGCYDSICDIEEVDYAWTDGNGYLSLVIRDYNDAELDYSFFMESSEKIEMSERMKKVIKAFGYRSML